MSILTIELAAILALGVMGLKDSLKHVYIKCVGTLALVSGVLGQFIGLYSAFDFISQTGQVSQEILIQGLKVSSITSIYGLTIFIISYLIWFGIKAMANKNNS